MNNKKQERLRECVNNDVFLNQSLIVDDLLKKEIYYYEDIENLYDSESGELREIFEWWSVSTWLLEKLREEKEPVLRTVHGDYWGRSSTGQSICLDDVIERIYG